MCSYIVRPLRFSIRYTESSVTDRKPLGFDDGVPIGSDKTEGVCCYFDDKSDAIC